MIVAKLIINASERLTLILCLIISGFVSVSDFPMTGIMFTLWCNRFMHSTSMGFKLNG